MFSTYFILLTDLYRHNLNFIMIFSGDTVRLFLINDIGNSLLVIIIRGNSSNEFE